MASDSSAVQRQIDALGGSTGVALSDPQVISDALLTDLVERDGGRHRCVERFHRGGDRNRDQGVAVLPHQTRQAFALGADHHQDGAVEPRDARQRGFALTGLDVHVILDNYVTHKQRHRDPLAGVRDLPR